MSLFGGDLFGKDKQDDDGGLLGLPTIPGLPGLTDILPTLGGPKTTSTSSETSSVPATTLPTTSLTLTAGTSTSTTATTTAPSTTPTSTSTSTTSDTTSTTSETTSSTSTTSSLTTESTSTTASLTDSTTAPTTAPTPPPPSTVTDTLPATLPTSTDAPATTSAAAATTPQSFLENKPLSVGVITTASILGLIFLVVIATWAIRKRRKDRIYDDILDFSPNSFSPNSNLVGRENDLEKGASATDVGSSVGHDGGGSMGHGTVPPPVQPRQMYQDNYGAPIYAPQPPPSRNANPYGAQPAYGAGAYNGGYQQNNSYDNWGYGYGNAAAPAAAYDQAYGGMDNAYGGMADGAMMAGVGAGAQPANPPQRRPSGQRKAPPPLNLPASNPIAQPTQVSPGAAAAAHPTLPDEFGAAGGDARRLMVRNE